MIPSDRTEPRAYAPSHALVIYQRSRSSWWLVLVGVLIVLWGLS